MKCTRTGMHVVRWAHHFYFANMVKYLYTVFFQKVFGREKITLIFEETPDILVERLTLGVVTSLG